MKTSKNISAFSKVNFTKCSRLLPLLIPIILTACADNTPSESIGTSAPESLPIAETAAPEYADSTENTENNSSDTETSEPGADYIGICGEVFNPENFKEKPDEVLNEYLYYQTDYGYTALFDGKIYNSYDNPDEFPPDGMDCTESCEPSSSGYFIINVGDKIGGLTCTEAFALYFINTKYSTFDPFGLMDATVCFEGEVEVTGYINRFDGDEGYVDEGELHFLPDGESWQGLPIPYISDGPYKYWTFSMEDGGLVYAPFKLSLGVIGDYSSLDLERDIPQGSTAHMKLVLKDIRLDYTNSNFGGYTISTAKIVSAEKIN